MISSLWEVEDKSTAALMRQLYEGLQNTGGDGAGALRQGAQRSFSAAAQCPTTVIATGKLPVITVVPTLLSAPFEPMVK